MKGNDIDTRRGGYALALLLATSTGTGGTGGDPGPSNEWDQAIWDQSVWGP